MIDAWCYLTAWHSLGVCAEVASDGAMSLQVLPGSPKDSIPPVRLVTHGSIGFAEIDVHVCSVQSRLLCWPVAGRFDSVRCSCLGVSFLVLAQQWGVVALTELLFREDGARSCSHGGRGWYLNGRGSYIHKQPLRVVAFPGTVGADRLRPGRV